MDSDDSTARQRALLITRAFPAASGTGAQQRSYNHLLALLNYPEVDVLIPVHRLDNLEELEAQRTAVAALSDRIGWVRCVHAPQLPDFQASLEVSIPAPARPAVDDVDITSYSVVLCFRVFSLKFAENHLGARPRGVGMPRFVVDFDDVESVALWREASQKRTENGLRRTWEMRWWAVRRYVHEQRAQAHADAVMVCSAIDRQRLVNRHAGEVQTVPNSVSVPVTQPSPPQRDPEGPLRLLFLGALFYPPNVDAIKWLTEEIFPDVRRARPDARLDLVGRRPTEAIRALHDPGSGIIVNADVPSVEPWYANADIVLAPIRFGGGTRIKILEAMAQGRAVITTTIGAEGIDLIPGRDAAFADSTDQFVRAVVALAEDPDACQAMAAAGWRRVRELYAADRVQQAEYERVLAPR